jgi:hypothetical protein
VLLLGVGQYSATLGNVDLSSREHGVPVAENGVTLQARALARFGPLNRGESAQVCSRFNVGLFEQCEQVVESSVVHGVLRKVERELAGGP